MLPRRPITSTRQRTAHWVVEARDPESVVSGDVVTRDRSIWMNLCSFALLLAGIDRRGLSRWLFLVERVLSSQAQQRDAAVGNVWETKGWLALALVLGSGWRTDRSFIFVFGPW